MSNISFKRKKYYFLGLSYLGSVLLWSGEKKGWEGGGQNQHSAQKGKHKVSSITNQSNLNWSQVLDLDHRTSTSESQPKTPHWSYWAGPCVPRRAIVWGFNCFYHKNWWQKLESSKLWSWNTNRKMWFSMKKNLFPSCFPRVSAPGHLCHDKPNSWWNNTCSVLRVITHRRGAPITQL